MPKRVFWPIALVVMGLVVLASRLQLLPSEFTNLWPILLIVIGLGGLLTSDSDEWLSGARKESSGASRPAKRSAPRASERSATRSVARKPARKVARKK